MPRLLFEKSGNAIWISHLDLMRLFQRAFKRAGLTLQHTQGYNPRPSVSIALPLSVGVESKCELLDFELDGQEVSCCEILHALNRVLVDGIKVLNVYDNGAKVKYLAFLDCDVTLEYDQGIPHGATQAIRSLFAQAHLPVEKKSKNGVSEQDIIPMIRSLEVVEHSNEIIMIHARICCQNPTLNPAQLCAAIERYLPQYQPDFSKCCRLELYNADETVFR